MLKPTPEYFSNSLNYEQRQFIKKVSDFLLEKPAVQYDAVKITHSLGWQWTNEQIEAFLCGLARTGVLYNVRQVSGVPHFSLRYARAYLEQTSPL